ncbi:rCG56057 [Rattus norvegicus]|uniref:RCG56057 n=1 Tax=Rattus norvegicus TaxID=10116 RepID=A6IAE4_RAT|nr:rCG56057 [Rattus norvegicus]
MVFLFLVLTYMLSIVGNQSIDVITLLESHLQVPIGFSFRSFSFLETSFTSTSIPQLLSSISTGIMTINFVTCFTQCFIAVFFGATEVWLLTATAYDCYVAISKPLHCAAIMSNRVCTLLVLCSCLRYSLVILLPIILTSAGFLCIQCAQTSFL